MGQPHYFLSAKDNSSFLFIKAECHNLWIKTLALYASCYYYCYAGSTRNRTFCSVPTSSKPKVKLHTKNYKWLNWNLAETQTQHEEFNSLKNIKRAGAQQSWYAWVTQKVGVNAKGQVLVCTVWALLASTEVSEFISAEILPRMLNAKTQLAIYMTQKQW